MGIQAHAAGMPLIVAAMVGTAFAHEHHTDEIPEGQGTSDDPIVSLWQVHLDTGGCEE
jgi:hypothetical protein